jgi:heme-degrading monooxygenase HmoA
LIVTIFRNRLSSGDREEYEAWAARMDALVVSMPGYISHKRFDAPDGERVTIAEFESEEAQAAWRNHPEHRKAQRMGKEKFYAEYDLKVCALKRHSTLR